MVEKYNKSIKVIFFDIGGVLLHIHPEKMIKQISIKTKFGWISAFEEKDKIVKVKFGKTRKKLISNKNAKHVIKEANVPGAYFILPTLSNVRKSKLIFFCSTKIIYRINIFT